MTEFMNSVSNKQSSYATTTNINTSKANSAQSVPVAQVQKNDSFELANKDKKKKIITYSAIAAGIGLSILAFLKRKQIGDFFSSLFNKKPKNPPAGDTPKPPKPPKGNDAPPFNNGKGLNSSGIPSAPPKAALPTLDEFQKLEKEDMPALVSKFAKGTKEEKQSLLNLYTTLDKKHASLPEESPERLSLGRKLYVLEKQMIEGNISFIPKAPSSFATEADKIKYIKSALHYANTNEASAMDALTVFEKYGSRYEYGSFKAININHGLYDLTIAVERVADKLDAATTDKVINQYLDIFNKYARIDGEYADTRLLLRMIEKNNDKMSENTVSKIIETLKKFSFEKSQTWSVRKYIVSNEFSKRSPEELARLDVKLKELEEIVKDMPMKNKAKPGA